MWTLFITSDVTVVFCKYILNIFLISPSVFKVTTNDNDAVVYAVDTTERRKVSMQENHSIHQFSYIQL